MLFLSNFIFNSPLIKLCYWMCISEMHPGSVVDGRVVYCVGYSILACFVYYSM